MKVYLDAGHGTPAYTTATGVRKAADGGAPNGSRYECNDTLKIANVLKTKFEAQGWSTVLARTNNSGKFLAERTAEANATKCDIYLSLHRNSFSNSTANGVEIWLHSAAPQRYKDWATKILADWKSLGFVNRGVKFGHPKQGVAEFGVNANTNMPSVLLEIGFISNPKDNVLYDTKMNEICDALVKRCCEFVGVSYKTTTAVPATPPVNAPTPTQTPPAPVSAAKRYRVQTNIYWGNKAYAEAFATKLSNMKIDGVSFKVIEE